MSRNSGMPHPVVGLLLLAFMVATHPVCLYAQDSGKTPPWYDAITFHGFVSTAYSYNFNKPDSMINSYRVFDFDDNSMKVDVVEISLSTSQVAAGEAGFRLDVTAGSSIPKITRSAGLETGDLDVQTAYVIYNAPLGSGLRLDFGKFTTPMGYEVIEGYDGFNDNYSRSLLFGYAVPFTHTGLRTSYAFTSGLSATLMLVNGWDVAVDNNRSKSVGAQIGWLPVSGMNLLVNYMTGPEKSGNDQDSRRVLDIVGVYAIGEMATIGVNLDFGTEEHSAVDGSTAEWGGMALYARFNLHQDVSVSIRGEQFEDRDGVRTGLDQTLREVTLTPEYRAAEHFTLRGDIRVDHSDKTVFQKEGGWTDVQTTVSVNALYVF